ncbi:uncharacterized protein THITE_2123963 [Thermothielavioides terrestris NRRL 8126]|uniref:Uncharacterized protein n=2 Tax=Thermothielavioides terrestris TaxID=2587410 RepID=G2RI48_THETT|nr:uncharacterized protein THITE_2123963 [Thermothielavioides terrestris NRRL 8126]AEO71510.1 hypothetical protein THITE_2123963 [Thermothielavioides terrestris NRRL 8126]
MAFLDNPELLLMHAQSTGSSVAAARLYFTKMLCGFDQEESAHTATAASTSARQNPRHSR